MIFAAISGHSTCTAPSTPFARLLQRFGHGVHASILLRNLQRLVRIGGLAQKKDHVRLLVCVEVDLHLKRAARVEAGAKSAGEGDALHRSGRSQRAVSSNERASVRRC